MPPVSGYHDVRHRRLAFASPKREFGGPPGGCNVSGRSSADEPNSRRRTDGRGGMDAVMAAWKLGGEAIAPTGSRDPRDPRRGVAVTWTAQGSPRRRLKVSTVSGRHWRTMAQPDSWLPSVRFKPAPAGAEFRCRGGRGGHAHGRRLPLWVTIDPGMSAVIRD
jgi:hypothetical protein